MTTLWSGGIVSIVGSGSFVSFDREIMYKQILLTDKELELLEQVLGWYIIEKRSNNDPHYVNAHIMLRHISGKKPTENSNQISFYGK